MTFTEIARPIMQVADFAELLPLSIFLFNRNIIYIFPFLFLELLTHQILDVSTFALSRQGIHNLYLYHIIGLTELVFIYLFYNRLLPLPKIFKYSFYVVISLSVGLILAKINLSTNE